MTSRLRSPFPRLSRLAALSLALAATATAASAGPRPAVATLPADLQRLAPAAPHAAAAGLVDDFQPPQLTGFKLPTTFDATKAGEDARVTFSATDNASGVFNGSFVVTGPNGETMTGWFGDDVPAKKVSQGRGFLDGTPWAVPGTWTLTRVSLYDFLGNGVNYDHDQLAAMGIRTDMTVANRKGGDAQAPTLVSGHLRTNTFSLSSVQPGTTGAAAIFVVDVHMQDSGDPQVSGVRLAQLTFCLDDQTHCMNVVSTNNQASGTADATVAAWQFPALVGLVPGLYHLRTVTLYDFAGNRRILNGAFFGGETDFVPLFGGTPDLLVTN